MVGPLSSGGQTLGISYLRGLKRFLGHTGLLPHPHPLPVLVFQDRFFSV